MAQLYTTHSDVCQSHDSPWRLRRATVNTNPMPEILAENLSGKAVMGDDGAELGMLYNVTMDLDSGRLHHLLIDQEGAEVDTDFDVDEDGHLLVPVNRVQAVKDHMIVRR
jgi:sporulation protein YlmC with PRC-barrel domain